MAKPTRNDPCPCGSGLKYKRCCSRRDEAESRQLEAARRTSNASGQMLFDFFVARYTPRIRRDAWEAFPLGDPAVPPQDLDMQIFAPWAMYHWQGAPQGRPACLWLDQAPEARDPDLAAFVRSALVQPFSFFEVVDVDPGRGILVRDILCSREVFVHEVSASRGARRWHILVAKIVPHMGFWFFEGMGPTPLPPELRESVRSLVRQRLHLPNSLLLEPKALLDHSLDVLETYREVMDQLRNRPRPTMTNTDEEMLVMCTSRYAFDPARQTGITSLLDRLPELGRAAPDLTTWIWSRPGNRMHADWDNTSIGQVRVGEGELVLETNSRERDAGLRAQLERVCGDRIRWVGTDARDMNDPAEYERMSAEEGETPEDDIDDEPIPPAVKRQILAELLERHYASWREQPLPVLNGMTPREAVATPAGRTQVETLIRSMEFHHDATEMPDFDFNRIRQALGLAPVRRIEARTLETIQQEDVQS